MSQNISYVEARYLKHAGKKIQVKVCFARTDDGIEIHIRDSVLYSFAQALQRLRHIAEDELGFEFREI